MQYSDKTLRLQGDTQTSMRLTDIVRISQEPDMKFVDRRGSQDFRVGDGDFLRAPDCQSVETRDARAALPAWIRIVEPVIVDKVVSGELSQARIGIDAASRFIVSDGFGERRSGEKIRSDVRLRLGESGPVD